MQIHILAVTGLAATFASAILAMTARPAAAFEFSFDWGDIPLCTSGIPNEMPNPIFRLSNVPHGTRYIRFELKDLDVPSYNHGGGIVPYEGQEVIAPGAFFYKSPCPPNEIHTYEWTAAALTSRNGGVLAIARATAEYP